jgi:hypothetical protein
MKTIWKFQVPVQDEITVDMPVGAKILTVQMQAGSPCIWALVDADAPVQPRHFAWRGTGHDAGGLALLKYVGTVSILGGGLIFHLFDRSTT